MPRGIAELKRRNGNSRRRAAHNRMWMNIAKNARTDIKRIFRTDLTSGEIKQIGRSEYENEAICFMNASFQKIPRFAVYTDARAIAWNELENGAILYANNNFSYRIEKIALEKPITILEVVKNKCEFCGTEEKAVSEMTLDEIFGFCCEAKREIVERAEAVETEARGICQLCGKPSEGGREHSECMDRENNAGDFYRQAA